MQKPATEQNTNTLPYWQSWYTKWAKLWLQSSEW